MRVPKLPKGGDPFRKYLLHKHCLGVCSSTLSVNDDRPPPSTPLRPYIACCVGLRGTIGLQQPVYPREACAGAAAAAEAGDPPSRTIPLLPDHPQEPCAGAAAVLAAEGGLPPTADDPQEPCGGAAAAAGAAGTGARGSGGSRSIAS